MRTILTAIFSLTAGPALAHIGHIGEVAGHGHWIALGGIAVAGAIALWGQRKRPAEDQAEAEGEDMAEDEEAVA